MKDTNKLIVNLLFFLFLASFFSSIALAETDSKTLATKTIKFEKDTQLIEWFSSTNCDECRIFEKNNFNSNYAWINWFNSENDEIDNFARDDTNRRLNQFNVSDYPLLIINGDIHEFNKNDTVENWNEVLESSVEKGYQKNLINFSLEIDLIDSTNNNKANEIKLYGEITPLSDLHNDTAIHIHIVENIADPDGSSARPMISNVLREWVPKTDFSVKKANTTEWEYSLSETYLESANINLNEGDSSRYSIVISVHGDELENSSSMHVLAVNKTTLPSIQEQAKWSNFPLIILGNVVIMVGICFIIIQERIREKGLPLLEGKILHSKQNEKEININIKTGNKKVEILDVNVNKGWRISRLKNLPSIAVKSDFNLKFKVTSKSGNIEESPLQITVKTDVDDLGQWMMDIDMVSDKNE
ncbi:MAG: hypothetical protein CL983_00250 [Euryarchaeota archaeon]|nr:hypothetical protein [Euryarchaeota archaeon]